MREYTITRPGHPGIVADDDTILAELRALTGTFTLTVEEIDEDDSTDE